MLLTCISLIFCSIVPDHEKAIFNLKNIKLTLFMTKKGPIFKVPNIDDEKEKQESICTLVPTYKRFKLEFKYGSLYADEIIKSGIANDFRLGYFFKLEKTNNGVVLKNYQDRCIQVGDEIRLGTYEVELGDCVENKFQLFEPNILSEVDGKLLEESTFVD